MRIALPAIHLDEIVFTPLPQLRLKKALVDTGYNPDNILITEHRRGDSLQGVLDTLVGFAPDVVGLSCYTWNFLANERVGQAIKSCRPETLVIWGGAHVSELPSRFTEKYPDSQDLAVSWYGEGAFPNIVNLHHKGYDTSDIAMEIPGVWADSVGQRASVYPPLNTLGYPYQWMPDSVTDSISERVFLLETYRNCPFACSYCLWGQAAKQLDALTAEQMYDYTHRAIEDGARIFMYADAGLGLVRNPDRSSRDKEVFRRFAEDRLDKLGVQMRGYFFWQTLDEETCDILADLIGQGVMGQLDIGIQTFNPNVLQDLQRATNYDRFHHVISMLHARGIRFSLDLILGLPGDDLDGFKDSLRKVIACQPHRTQSFPLSVLPGTTYDLRREELGIQTIRGSYHDDAETVVATNSFSYGEMQEALDLEAWMFLWYAEGLFLDTLTVFADEKETDPLDMIIMLKEWSSENAPALTELATIYRDKLYDSRSEGRYLVEGRLMEVLPEVYLELHKFLLESEAEQSTLFQLKHEFMKFPKTHEVAERLAQVSGTNYDGALRWNGRSYHHRQDPVIGAIVRNRSFYAWEVKGDKHHTAHFAA